MLVKKIVLILLISIINLFSSEIKYTIYNETQDDNYYVKVDGITNPIQLIQLTGVPFIREIESLSENIKLLHASAGGQGTNVIVDYNYTYILNMKKKKSIGFLQYNDDGGYYTQANKTPEWTLTDDFVIVIYYDEDENIFKQTKFKL